MRLKLCGCGDWVWFLVSLVTGDWCEALTEYGLLGGLGVVFNEVQTVWVWGLGVVLIRL